MLRKLIGGIFWVLLLAGAALGQGVTTALVVPTEKVAAGSTVGFSIVLLNPRTEVARATLPAELRVRLEGEKRSWLLPVTVQTPAASVIQPGTFSNATCTIEVPAEAVGRLVFELEFPKASAVLEVEPATLVAGTDREKVPAPLESNAAQVPALSHYHRVFAENISTHHPIYFIFGAKKPAAKFQFSFKYRLWGDRSNAGTLNPPLAGVYFGYTQRSIWDITSYSSPFYDTSYMPELMYQSLAPASWPTGILGLRWFGYQAAVQHESNGRDGASSRSLNLVYVRPMVGRELGWGWTLGFAPKLFIYADNLSDNRDLPRYRGYGEYVLVLAQKSSLSLTATGRIGSHFDRGSMQFDLTQPLQITYMNFASYLMVQYFDGYGESLLGYDKKSRMLRAGFSLVR